MRFKARLSENSFAGNLAKPCLLKQHLTARISNFEDNLHHGGQRQGKR